MSNKVKKILFCDVDGILLDFVSFTSPYLAAAYGVKIPENYVPSSWNMTELAPKGKEITSWESIVPDDWPLHLKTFSKTREFLDKMHDKGYHIILVTRLGQKRQLFRLENLAKNKLYYDEIFFTAHGQSKAGIIMAMLKRYDPNKWIFIDDKALTCTEILEVNHKNAKVYTLDYPFNANIRKQDPKDLIWLKSEVELYRKVVEDA